MTPLAMSIFWTILGILAVAVAIGTAVEWMTRYERLRRKYTWLQSDLMKAKKDAEEWEAVADSLARDLAKAKGRMCA